MSSFSLINETKYIMTFPGLSRAWWSHACSFTDSSSEQGQHKGSGEILVMFAISHQQLKHKQVIVHLNLCNIQHFAHGCVVFKCNDFFWYILSIYLIYLIDILDRSLSHSFVKTVAQEQEWVVQKKVCTKVSSTF